jgi:3',5'-cyclic AMP phosphodiesterase CpdA
MIIAQISDLHIQRKGELAFGKVDTAACLKRCVDAILRFEPQPDVLFASGDLADFGTAEEYRYLRELLAPLPIPVYLMPGNHDDRENLRLEFHDHAYFNYGGAFLDYTVEVYPLRLIALDTVVPHQGGGLLRPEQLQWLDERLGEQRRKPTMLLLHHPPFATGIPFMDAIALANAEKLGRIVEKYRNIEAVVCGHVHRSISRRWHGTIAMTCPSPAHQITLDLREDSPESFILEPPGFLLHYWDGATLVSHTVPVGDFAGPYPFE